MKTLYLASWYPAHPNDLEGSFFREQAIALTRVRVKVGVIAPRLRSLRQPVKSLLGNSGLTYELDQGIGTYRASIANLTPRVWGLTARRVSMMAEQLFDAFVADHWLPDVLHVHAALPVGQAAITLSEKYNIPIIYSEHSSAFARGVSGIGGFNLVEQLTQKATRSFAVSKPFARLLEDKTNMSPGSIGVMPNSVNANFLNKPLSNTNDSKIRFLHVSMLNSNKNVASLLEAFSIAFGGKADAILGIGGDGPDRAVLEQLAVKLGISEQVTFYGRLSRSEVADAMAMADVFVLPSKYETFGVVVIEALAMGLQVVATRCGGPDDIIKENDGLLVPVDDAEALATALSQSAYHQTIENKLARRERCRRRFGAEEIANQWLEVYAEAVVSNGDNN